MESANAAASSPLAKLITVSGRSSSSISMPFQLPAVIERKVRLVAFQAVIPSAGVSAAQSPAHSSRPPATSTRPSQFKRARDQLPGAEAPNHDRRRRLEGAPSTAPIGAANI